MQRLLTYLEMGVIVKICAEILCMEFGGNISSLVVICISMLESYLVVIN